MPKNSSMNMLENASIPVLLNGVSQLPVFYFHRKFVDTVTFCLLMYWNANHLKNDDERHVGSICSKCTNYYSRK